MFSDGLTRIYECQSKTDALELYAELVEKPHLSIVFLDEAGKEYKVAVDVTARLTPINSPSLAVGGRLTAVMMRHYLRLTPKGREALNG